MVVDAVCTDYSRIFVTLFGQTTFNIDMIESKQNLATTLLSPSLSYKRYGVGYPLTTYCCRLVVPFMAVAIASANAWALRSAPVGLVCVWSLGYRALVALSPSLAYMLATAWKWSTKVTLELAMAVAAVFWYPTNRGAEYT